MTCFENKILSIISMAITKRNSILISVEIHIMATRVDLCSLIVLVVSSIAKADDEFMYICKYKRFLYTVYGCTPGHITLIVIAIVFLLLLCCCAGICHKYKKKARLNQKNKV